MYLTVDTESKEVITVRWWTWSKESHILPKTVGSILLAKGSKHFQLQG